MGVETRVKCLAFPHSHTTERSDLFHLRKQANMMIMTCKNKTSKTMAGLPRFSYKIIQCALLVIAVVSIFLVGHTFPQKTRIVTKEELARHDGNQTKGVLWLSIMSKVYDVSKGSEYYGEGGPYHVFVGRDGNVPFITGTFNDEEASKPLTELTPHQLFNLETWTDFYEKEDKYPFIGLLEGDLYDKDGNPTPMMEQVQEMIAEGRRAADEQKKKRQEVIARRKREAAEKKKLEEQGKQEPQKPKPAQPKGDKEALIIEPLEQQPKSTEEL